MRKLLIACAIIAITVASAQCADAGKRRRGYNRSRAYNSSSQRTGFFARLMELERRKNQFLFGR